MDAKTRDLVLLAALSLFCATVAWSADYAVFASVFVALTAVAVLRAASPRTGADMDKDYLTLKRVPTGANVEDYDVLCGEK